MVFFSKVRPDLSWACVSSSPLRIGFVGFSFHKYLLRVCCPESLWQRKKFLNIDTSTPTSTARSAPPTGHPAATPSSQTPRARSSTSRATEAKPATNSNWWQCHLPEWGRSQMHQAHNERYLCFYFWRIFSFHSSISEVFYLAFYKIYNFIKLNLAFISLNKWK